MKEILEIKGVCKKYQSKENEILALENINFSVSKGEFLSIIGPSGCGKSSLIKAICKLEKGDGEIFIAGKNINSLTRKDISEIIALVPQSPFLIAGTIYENICYGMDKEVSLEEVEEAAKKAYIYDYINNLPDKFNTLISEGGNNLSGGQRQRIAIARIFLRKPKILILDEATSALDNTSERHIQIEIEKLQKEEQQTQDVLGDIVINLAQVEKQAEEYGHSFERELSYMLVHGFYHLMGYDHIEEEDKTKMRQKEESILNKIGMERK